jgi:hypothetical protein
MILKAAPAVAGKTADRIYFGVAAQNERRPRLVLSVVSKVHPHNHDGHGGYVNGRLRVDCLAPDYEQAKDLAAVVRAALDNYTGTVDGTNVAWIELDEESDIETEPQEGKATATCGVSVDFEFLVLE